MDYSGAPDCEGFRAPSALVVALALFATALLFPASALAGGSGSKRHVGASEAAEAARWGYLIGLGIVVAILLIGIVAGARVRMLVVGQDGRVSTSKTIAASWTGVVAAALLGAVYANILNHPEALKAMGASGIVGQYAVLFGGPLGAAILSKQIAIGQAAKNPRTAGSPSLKDLIAGDAGDTDLGDFQYVLFNLVALIYVISTLVHSPTNGLPHIPGVLLGLTSVSAVGYVGKKVLIPTSSLAATMTPKHGAVDTDVTIKVTGVLTTAAQLSAGVRFGDAQDGRLVNDTAPVADSKAEFQVKTPDLGVPANTEVEVSVVTDNAIVKAGKFKYT